MNWDSVGVYSANIPNLTPNIDRLAYEGIRFEHAHVTIAIIANTSRPLTASMSISEFRTPTT